jgi:hypothetical protein
VRANYCVYFADLQRHKVGSATQSIYGYSDRYAASIWERIHRSYHEINNLTMYLSSRSNSRILRSYQRAGWAILALCLCIAPATANAKKPNIVMTFC